MSDKKYIDIINSKTFEEIVEGYKRSITLIKQIDKDGYREITIILKI